MITFKLVNIPATAESWTLQLLATGYVYPALSPGLGPIEIPYSADKRAVVLRVARNVNGYGYVCWFYFWQTGGEAGGEPTFWAKDGNEVITDLENIEPPGLNRYEIQTSQITIREPADWKKILLIGGAVVGIALLLLKGKKK